MFARSWHKVCADCEKSWAHFHTAIKQTPSLKNTRPEEANTSLRQGYEWRRIKTLFMAHYQGLYGKITQPSDKLVVIDSESETSAPAAAGVGRREALLALKMAHNEKIWAYWSDHTSIGCGGWVRIWLSTCILGDLWLHLCQPSLNLLPVSCYVGFQNCFLLFIHRETVFSPSKRAYLIARFIVHNPSHRHGSERLLAVF